MNTLLETKPAQWVRQIQPDDFPVLEAVATADNHSVVAPTHVFLKHGQVAGYASVGNVPLVITYFDPSCRARDSLYFINQLELLVGNALPPGHHGIVAVPFGPNFEPLMGKLGYQSGGKLNVGFKKLKG